jgi:CDP-diacylglycerol---glycerol-3-phosphate 3-phosphatidyltransferase
VASAEGFALAASELGKTKMVLEVIAITALILAPRFAVLHPWDRLLLWLVVLFAVASATQYFWNFWKTLEMRGKAAPACELVILPGGKEEREKKDVAAH